VKRLFFSIAILTCFFPFLSNAAPSAKISVTPASVNLGSVKVAGTSGPQTVTIKNTGNEDLAIDSITITGANQTEFHETGSCSTISPKGFCPIALTFTPVAPFGTKSATMRISSSDPKKPALTVKLSGQAPPPKISTTQPVNFGSVQEGSTSAPKQVTVKNTGVSDLSITNVAIAGSSGMDFNQTNNCSAISQGASCTINITFTPSLPASKESANLSISSNDPKKPNATVKLSGQGEQGAAAVNGVCGPSNNRTFTSAPATGLCSAGTSSVISGTGPWTWTCRGTNGGTNASCSAMTAGSTSERALAQTGLSIALASNVLQSQVLVLFETGTPSLPCHALNGGGSSRSGSTPTSEVSGHPMYPVTVYYDDNCTQPYIVAEVTGATLTGDGNGILAETATYYGPGGTILGTMTLSETLAETFADNAIKNVAVHGLGTFTPVSGLQTPVQLGLSCDISADVATFSCTGGVAQDFPVLALAVGSVTTLNLNIPGDPFGGPSTGSVTFNGGGPVFTGPIGTLTLTNPSSDSFIIQGGTAYTTTTAVGSAAAFSLFPPTPTSWTLTDAAHDEKLDISVVSNTTRDLSLTITRVSTGETLVTGTIDQSGTGTIVYSDGRSAAITSWTLAD
jgi:hypothetical protein